MKGPRLSRARALASGHLGSRKAVLYTCSDTQACTTIAQTVKTNLEKIGIAVTIKAFPYGAFFDRISTRGEPFDIALLDWLPDYIEPYAYLNVFLDGRLIAPRANTNLSYFDVPKYNRMLHAAARLRGAARYRAYGKLDVVLAHDAAPMVAYAFSKQPTLVSKRVDCVVLRPALDLAAVCLKH